MTRHPSSPWPARDDELRKLWATGLSTSLIGERMGVTKGSIIGRSHRLNLPPRRLPIRRPDPPRQKRPAPVAAFALAVDRKPVAAPAPMPAPPVVYLGSVHDCCWIEGHPAGTRTLYCGEPSEPGSPYCSTHEARAYVRVRRAA
jgi:GcrA cell cycle regulator